MNTQDITPTPVQENPLSYWEELTPSEKLEAMEFLIEAHVLSVQQLGEPANEADKNAFQLLKELLSSAIFEAKVLEKKALEDQRA
jgi:hypothetical protein